MSYPQTFIQARRTHAMRFIVLGGYGGMGSICVRDLFQTTDADIVVAGRSLPHAQAFARSFRSPRVKAAAVDVTDINATAKLVKGADVCINCVQYYYNVDVMKACLKAKVNYIDLGGLYHVTLKQLQLNRNFLEAGKIAVLGCGSTPGTTNVMASYGGQMMETVREVHVRFGDRDYTKWGVPFVVPYSMHTVFDEFMMQPAVLENGRHKFVAPRSGEKTEDYPHPVGSLESFRILHSELATLPNYFKKKGIRTCDFKAGFPRDFVEKVDLLIEAGFASKGPVRVGTKRVVPRDVVVAVLHETTPKKGVRVKDVEMLVVELVGRVKGRPATVRVICEARTHKNAPAGAWDTGTPPSIIAQMIASGQIKMTGVVAPESCVPHKPFFKELEKRGMHVYTDVAKHEF